MKLSFSIHFQQAVYERNISIDHLKKTIKEPDSSLPPLKEELFPESWLLDKPLKLCARGEVGMSTELSLRTTFSISNMKVHYDKVADAMYIRLRAGKIKGTVKVHDRLMVDVDAKGNTLGVELLDASLQLSNRGVRGLERDVAAGIPVEIIAKTPVAA